MPVDALLLILGAAFLHVGWNALAKRGRDRLVFLWITMMMGSLLLALPAALVVLQAGAPPSGWIRAAISAAVHAAYFVSLSRAYDNADLSLVYPLSRGLAIVLVAVLAWPLIGEPPTMLGMTGVLLVLAGATFVVRYRHSARAPGASANEPTARDHAGARAPRTAVGLAWTLLTAALIAVYSLVDKQGTARLHPLPYLVIVILGACLLLSPYVLTRPRSLLLLSDEWRANGRSLMMAAVFSVSAYLVALFALQRAPVAHVVAAREISIALSVVAGRLWLGEHPPLQRYAGALAIVAGVACLTLAK